MADGTATEAIEGVSHSGLADRVTRLRTLADSIDACESADELYERCVTPDGHVLDFDAAIVATVEADVFVPRAAYTTQLRPTEPLADDGGIAGATLASGTTTVVDDVRTEAAANPTGPYRSALSIPFGEDVLQFHHHEPGAFSQVDREFGELFVSIATSALDRIRYERARDRERDQFAALFENVPDAALSYRVEDGVKTIQAVNSAFVSVFGVTGEDVVDEPVSSVVRPSATDSVSEPHSTGEIGRRADVEVTRQTVDGPRPFLLRNVPMRSDDEVTRGYLIYTDLEALKARERELERKNERLDQFASMVSHDLRNPLNVAAGYLDLAREEHDCAELRSIEQAHRRMERLIEDLLSLARAGDTVDEVQPVHLGTVAREAWDNVSTTDAQIEIDGDAIVEADPGQLLGLLENLFRNSVEHGSTSSQGGSRPDDSVEHGSTSSRPKVDDSVEHGSTCQSTTIESPATGNHPATDDHPSTDDGADTAVSVRLGSTPDGFFVADDGPGIPPEDRERIFESGYTTAEENTGLGLAIVDQIREAHDWDATVGVGVDGGARFDFVTGEPSFDLTDTETGESSSDSIDTETDESSFDSTDTGVGESP
ncbi:multi-sensor signal transduction histidine kinase [Halovivax asiaticus JCM 14624]|uniref:histidine kinase n=1 Tax=Halovivax asiaticus JCM 14624 TaxID=1227490 RepID=M0BP89_9EURY|nr:histidine kinase dimerization/phospho-acceptor domain-containing protein [Halovivax asiaticus]ELZ12118.1 multi-sensor signal transduction histidine kinase [Halovivax asiaticus JCM 14624]